MIINKNTYLFIVFIIIFENNYEKIKKAIEPEIKLKIIMTK